MYEQPQQPPAKIRHDMALNRMMSMPSWHLLVEKLEKLPCYRSRLLQLDLDHCYGLCTMQDDVKSSWRGNAKAMNISRSNRF